MASGSLKEGKSHLKHHIYVGLKYGLSNIHLKYHNMNVFRSIIILYGFVFLPAGELQSQASAETTEWLEWKHQTSGQVYATPLVTDGTVYIGSTDSVFYALDAFSGKEKWRFHSGYPIRSSAAVQNKRILFESGNRLFALNARGKLIWERDLCDGEASMQLDPWDFHRSSPYLHEGVVYIGTEDGSLLGFAAISGEQVLSCQTLSEFPIRTTPVVHDHMVIYGDWNGVIYANDISNGMLVWKYDTKKDGTHPWPNSILTNLVVAGESLYFAGKSNRLYALDVDSGNKKWHYSSPTDQWLIGGPVVKDGVVYLGSSDQNLFHAIDASNGNVIWITELDSRIWGNAAIKEGRIHIGSNSLFVLDIDSGVILRQYEFPRVHEERTFGEYVDRTANFHSSPILFEDIIIIGSDDGNVYAVRKL